MEWSFKIGSKKYMASFESGVFSSDSNMLSVIVGELIKSKTLIRPGYLAPFAPASLSSEALAWGTITRGIRMIATDRDIQIPVIADGLEPM